MGFRTTLGRILLASLIFVSAWVHLERPETFEPFYAASYELASPLASQYGIKGLPSVAEVNNGGFR